VQLRRGQPTLTVWISRFCAAGEKQPIHLGNGADLEIECGTINVAGDTGRLVDFIKRGRWTPKRAEQDAIRFAQLLATSSAGEAILSEVPPGLSEADRHLVAAFYVFLTQAGHPGDSPESTTKAE